MEQYQPPENWQEDGEKLLTDIEHTLAVLSLWAELIGKALQEDSFEMYACAVLESYALEVFPTRVGVNRLLAATYGQSGSFPHTRGGEPQPVRLMEAKSG